LARIRELHALNPDKARTRRRKWEQRNPDKTKAYSAKQIAKQKAKLAELERKAADADSKVADLEKQLEQAKQKRDHLLLQIQGEGAVIRAMVDNAFPKFERLFSLPDIEKNQQVLVDGWTHPDYSKAEIKAAARAYLQRAPMRMRARIAARWLVSAQTGKEFDTVSRYDRAS
jgi:predicted RNase H-like nuclease (RuvC/YqgF family)